MIEKVTRYKIPTGQIFPTERKAQEAILDALQAELASKLQAYPGIDSYSIYRSVVAVFDSKVNGTDRDHQKCWDSAILFLNALMEILGRNKLAKCAIDGND